VFKSLLIIENEERGRRTAHAKIANLKGVLHAMFAAFSGGGRRLREVWERSYVAFFG
jgi:hypothetical protein